MLISVIVNLKYVIFVYRQLKLKTLIRFTTTPTLLISKYSI